MEDLKKGLGIPMYGLHYIDSINDVDYKADDVELFKRDYSLEDRKRIFNSLEWAMNNKETNYKEIMPLPKDKFSNNEIFQYLEKLYLFMKKNRLDKE